MKNKILPLIMIILIIMDSCQKYRREKDKYPETIGCLNALYLNERYDSVKFVVLANMSRVSGNIRLANRLEAASVSAGILAGINRKFLRELNCKLIEQLPKINIQSLPISLEVVCKNKSTEINEEYPEMIKIAGNEKAFEIRKFLEQAMKAEKNNKILFENLLRTDVKELPVKIQTIFYVCPHCGNTFDDSDLSQICPTCMLKKEKFIIIK